MLLFKGFLTLCLADLEKGVEKGSKSYIEIEKRPYFDMKYGL
jgi:hypothetical protein